MIPVTWAARVPLVGSLPDAPPSQLMLTAKATAPESLMEICSGPLNAVRLKKYWPLVVIALGPDAVLPKTFVCRLVGLIGPPASVYLISHKPVMESPPVARS